MEPESSAPITKPQSFGCAPTHSWSKSLVAASNSAYLRGGKNKYKKKHKVRTTSLYGIEHIGPKTFPIGQCVPDKNRAEQIRLFKNQILTWFDTFQLSSSRNLEHNRLLYSYSQVAEIKMTSKFGRQHQSILERLYQRLWKPTFQLKIAF